MYSFPWYSKIALGPNSFLASSNAFLKFVLYFGKPEDLAILNTEEPSFFMCCLRLATSDFFISVCMKTIVLGDVFELIISYPKIGFFTSIASCVDSSKSSITIFLTTPEKFSFGFGPFGARTPSKVK